MTGASQYLLVLYAAERQGSAPVAPGVVAEALGRSPAAATETLQRLEDRGLVAREPYEGATLTDEGREAAADLYEAYVTLSRFFREVLDLEDYHEEAMQLAGTVSPTVADRLASILPPERPLDASDDAEGPAPLPLAEAIGSPGRDGGDP